GVTCVPAEALRADPASAAAAAIAALPRECTRIVVHFDVDVVDFVDAPLSENTGRNIGVPLDAAFGALTAITADGRTQALTLSELQHNHHAAVTDIAGGAMNGFSEMPDKDGKKTMLAYSTAFPGQLPDYWGWARRYALLDHTFSSGDTSSFPNRLYTVAANAA